MWLESEREVVRMLEIGAWKAEERWVECQRKVASKRKRGGCNTGDRWLANGREVGAMPEIGGWQTEERWVQCRR